jgi:glycine hydroxymethyltransferase
MLADREASEALKRMDGTVYELVESRLGGQQSSEQYHRGLFGALAEADKEVYELIRQEYDRLENSIQLIAAENRCSRAVLAALGSVVQNKTTEGFAGARYHGGCEVVDTLERLAVSRAKEAFGAHYANVQPHSGTAANQIVLTALLNRGDRILSLGLDQGGHVSHGAPVSFSGKFFDVENYYVDKETFLLDYEAIRDKALQVRPKLIVCGASAYSRKIDFERFRAIADEVGAYLLADISHIAGLVIAGVHPSPIDHAHFTTTSTYKPGGPRGGLILMGKNYDRLITVGTRSLPLWVLIQKATFPGVQGTPYLNNIAAKAVFFKETLSAQYMARQFKIVENAKSLAGAMTELGYDVLTGGTDNHMILVNVAHLREGLTGAIAQKCLENCGIIINMNRLPYDTRGPAVTSGMRLGTPIVTRNGMGAEQMRNIGELMDRVLRGVEIVNEREYRVGESLRDQTRDRVRQLCSSFPIC